MDDRVCTRGTSNTKNKHGWKDQLNSFLGTTLKSLQLSIPMKYDLDPQQKSFPPQKSEEERLVIVFKVENKSINQRAESKTSVLHSRHYFPETTVDGFHLNHLTTCLRKVSPHVHTNYLST